MRKHTKRKHWDLQAPAIRLTEKHSDDLGLQVHLAASSLDTEEGITKYIRLLTIATIAMEHSQTHNKATRSVLGTSVGKLEKLLDADIILESDEVYLKRTASLIDEWLATGKITYAGLLYAKKAVKHLEVA